MSGIKKVLVTGAAGTVGNYVVRHLLKKGFGVVSTDISLDRTPLWPVPELEEVEGDLTYNHFIRQVFETQKPDAIIHCAALIDVSLPMKELEKINVNSAVNLYRALAKYDGKMFVFLSSGSIYGPAPLLTEKVPAKPSSPYEETKAMAEILLQIEYSANMLSPRLAILRPSLIYGPRNKFLAANYLASAIIFAELLGRGLPKFSHGPKTNLVHAEDVARAAVFLMEQGTEQDTALDLPKNIFNICDDSVLGFGDHLSAIVNASGYKELPIPLPLPPARFLRLFKRVYESRTFLKGLNAVLGKIWKILVEIYDLEDGFVPDINAGMTPFFGQDTIFSNAKIKKAGLELKHPDFKEGIKTIIPWYKRERWIP